MDIKMNTTINLSADDIRQIVSEYLAKQGYNVGVENIKFNVGEECHGYRVGEHYETVFRGCSVCCENRNAYTTEGTAQNEI